jgi:hypothetical protein
MANITLAIDAETVRKVRKLALDRDTTLTAMVREFLERVAAEEDARRQQAVQSLGERIARYRVRSNGRRWNREELHERG